ncbi:hypothetical protein KUW09_25070 [Mameliella alba]|nr:hypothetical protein [Antarctobacter heliothermus]MBY6147335.1 hypothetical protein [Mameliella alba]
MTEFAIEALSSNDAKQISALVRRMVEKWPQLPALSITFAITSAAAHLETLFADIQTERSAARAYKLAALVASDILALEAMGGRPIMCHDLLHYWQRMDPYFLKL